MKSKLIAAIILTASALTSMAANAQIFNSFLFDQMQAPSAKTRAEVKAEVLQAQRERAAPTSAYDGAAAQQTLAAPSGDKPGTAPQAAADVVKTVQ